MLNSILISLSSQNGFWPWLQTKDDADFNIFLRLGNFEIAWYAVFILSDADFILGILFLPEEEYTKR